MFVMEKKAAHGEIGKQFLCHNDKDLKRWLYDWSDDVLSDYDD